MKYMIFIDTTVYEYAIHVFIDTLLYMNMKYMIFIDTLLYMNMQYMIFIDTLLYMNMKYMIFIELLYMNMQ